MPITTDTAEEHVGAAAPVEARGGSWPRRTGWLAAAVILWLLDVGVWRFIRGRGAGLSGDEPHYLVLARMLAHGSLHPFRFYQQEVKARAFYAWPSDLLSNTATWHAYPGPHGLVTIHGLGLPAVLAPFVELGGRSGGIVGLMGVEAVLWVYLFARAADLAGLRRPARVVAMLALIGPAVWIASSQLYPDFLAGLLIAIAVVEVARVEIRAGLDGVGMAAAAVSLALLPWLHIKNLAPGAVIVAALVVMAVRAGAWRRTAVALVPVVLSWLGLLVYNLWGFGHPLGEPQPSPLPSWAALTHGMGLLFDRHQGLVVQVPTVILGACGLWVARRVVPVAAAATVLAVATLVYLNASYVGVPYGGTAVAGRFSWSDMAPLLLWVPFLLVRIGSPGRLWTLGGAVAAAWVLQAVPILAGSHVYYNAQITGAPWDPSQYPGWWGPLNRILPELVPRGPQWGSPAYAIVIAVLLTAVIAVTTMLAASARSLPGAALAGGFGLCAVVVAVLASVASPPLPAQPLVFPGRAVGSPLITGPSPGSGPTVPLQGIGSGAYAVTVRYHLTGTATMTVYCTTGTPAHPGPPTSPSTVTLQPRSPSVTTRLRCPAGLLWFSSAGGTDTRLDISTVLVSKTGT